MRVMRGPRLWVEQDEIRWSVDLLVPADGRVVVLGPITGTVSRRGRLRPPVVNTSSSTVNAAILRQQLRHQLGKDKFLSARAAGILALAPFPQLPLAVATALGAPSLLTETAFSDSDGRATDDAWSDPGLIAHLGQVYSELDWAHKSYISVSRPRQTLVDLTAAVGGTLTIEELALFEELLDLPTSSGYLNTLPETGSRARFALPPVIREGDWSRSSPASAALIVSRHCLTCSQPATRVVPVPEVPGDLLCGSCFRPPAAPELRFPAAHAELALPEHPQLAEAVRQIEQFREERRAELGRKFEPAGGGSLRARTRACLPTLVQMAPTGPEALTCEGCARAALSGNAADIEPDRRGLRSHRTPAQLLASSVFPDAVGDPTARLRDTGGPHSGAQLRAGCNKHRVSSAQCAHQCGRKRCLLAGWLSGRDEEHCQRARRLRQDGNRY